MSMGKQFLSAVLAEGSVASLLQQGPIDHLFKGMETSAYEFAKEFVFKHQALPKADTILEHTGEALTPHKEPSSYYLEQLKSRHIELTLKKTMQAAADHLKGEDKDVKASLKVLTDGVMQLIARDHGQKIVDFREAYTTIMMAYANNFHTPEDKGLQLGWESFDKMSGGLGKGDMLSMIGRPAKGKTFQMLYAALNGWQREGNKITALKKAKKDIPVFEQSRMFVSMEMGVLPIQQRLTALASGISMDHLKHATLTTTAFGKMKGTLTTVAGFGAPFYVVDGNLTATVEDIWMIMRQLNPDACFIDGGYLLKHPTERDRFKRVAENADLMKTMLCPLAPLVVSWQFAKSASKKKKAKDEKVDLDDIGYSDAIAQVSSIVLALLEDESVETSTRRRIEIMKGRNGEVGGFLTNWDFYNMDFREISEAQSVEELSFA